jgi:mono/diheme cytochrome c family protein
MAIHYTRFSAAFVIAALVTGAAMAQEPDRQGDPREGRDFALQVCTPCHVVSGHQLSPRRFAIGPDFDAVANAATTTPSGLHAFLSSPHPTMPNLILTRQDQENVITYIMSLKR